MGLRLRRTPVIVTRTLLGLAVMATIAGPPLANILLHKNALASSIPDMSNVHYAQQTTFVRESVADTSAQLVTYKATTKVEFYIDGNVDSPVEGSNQGAYDANFDTWQLNAPLGAGSHTITAKVTIDNERYDVPGNTTVYSLDVPEATYYLPNANQQVFRPSDAPLRVKIDDQFGQFKDVTFSLYRYDADNGQFGTSVGDFTVTRDHCDLQKAGEYVVCDVSTAPNWQQLTEGTYAVKLKTDTFAHNGIQTDMEQYWLHFGVDTTPPGAGVRVEDATTVKDLLMVSASAYDVNGIDSVGFYVTAPNDDGSCTDDGTRLVGWRSGTPGDDGRYHATLDVSGIITGGKSAAKFCVTAISRDKAGNDSQTDTSSFFIDHTAPVVTLKVTSSSKPSASTPVELVGSVDGASTLELFSDGAKVNDFALAMNGPGQWSYQLDKGLEKGDHLLHVVATDRYGNVSSETSSPQSSVMLAVSAYVPPKEQRILSSTLSPPQLTSTLTPTPSITQIIASRHASDTLKSDEAVLGAETANSETAGGSAIAAGSNGWTFFGIAWYWWLLMVALFAGAGSWVVGKRKTSSPRIYA
jgi:hypothetical protein